MKKIDLENRLKRALADYQNLQKRVAAEKAAYYKFAAASLLEKLLPVVDGLEKAVQHLKSDGLNLVFDQLKQVLESEGVEKIKALHQPFDPQKMDCLELVKGPKDEVVEVTQRGYTLSGQVLRPAKVKVGKGGK
jgi:molecular chaperone GrpE